MKQTGSNKSRPKRIIFEVSDELYKTLKITAIERNLTLRKWLVGAIAEKIKRDE